MILNIVKRALPQRLKWSIRRAARLIVGPIQVEPDLILRQDAVASLLLQRMEALEAAVMKEVHALGEAPDALRGDLLARQDDLTSLLQQRMEALEAAVMREVRTLGGAPESLRADLLARQDELAQVLEQRMENVAAEVLGALRRAEDVPLLTDEEYLELEARHHSHEYDGRRADALIQHYLAGRTRVIELGCGAGDFLVRLNAQGHTARGVDINPAAVAACLERGLEVRHEDAVRFLAGEPARSHDAVVCLHLVEHLPNRGLRQLLEEAYRVLRNRGVLLIETPKVASLATMADYYYVDPTHRTPRHHNQLAFVLEKCGFASVEIADVPQPGGEFGLETKLPAGSGNSRLPAKAKEQIQRNFEAINGSLYVPRNVLLSAVK